MGHRHFTNTFNMFGTNQGHNHNHSSAEQSNVPMGGAVPSENVSFACPMDNMLRAGANCDTQWNSEGRAYEYSSSNFSMEVQHLPPPFLGRPYDPYTHSSAAGNLYLAPQISAGHVHSSYYNRPVIHDIEGGLLDPTTATVRGAFKRKSPSFARPCERGSTSRFSGAGSSSSSSLLLLENPTSDYQSIPPGPPIGLPQYGGSSLSVPGEDSMRNVRSRSRLYIEPNTTRTHLPSYPSHHYHSTTLPRNPSGMVVPHGNLNADVTNREWTHVPLSATAHGRIPISDINGSSYETNRFLVGGSAADTGSCHHDFVSSGHPVSSRYFHGPHAQAQAQAQAQATREGGSYHSRMAIPSYRTSLSYSHLGNEAASMDNGLHSHSESFYSRYSRTAPAGGLRNSYRNGRSRIAIERLQSISSVVDAGSEVLMVADRSSMYDGSRASFDQYGDMRLDIDNMSYEELLALGERIGDVSTGVSEDMMSNCLIEKVYYSADQHYKEEKCAICLEEYKAGEGIGTLKNCGHGYHVGCIRKWLLMKNVCPICKAPALKECSNQ